MQRSGDEEILRLMRQVEAAEDAADAAMEPEQEPRGDPCSFCGEPAEHTGSCAMCQEDGCLPPDVWSPGMNEPCLTLCVRCAREIHLACAVEDEAGNPRCPTCKF